MKKILSKDVLTWFLVILTFLVAIAAPALALGANGGNQTAKTSAGAEPLTFLSSDMPPFGTLQDGKSIGFAVEILHEIMQRLGRVDTIEFDDWKVVYERALTEPNTVLWPPSRTPEREELFKWVGPLIPEKIVLFALKDSRLVIHSLEDAKMVGGIATVTGYASEKLLKEKGFSNLVSQRSPIQGPDALKFGRADLWINSNITMKQTALDANVDPDLFVPVFVVKEIPSYLAFSKSVPDEVVNRWQTSLDDMKRDGSWEKIISEWVPRELLRIGAPPVNFTEKEHLWIEAHPTVKVVHSFHQPPFNLDVTDSPTGYLYDLLFEVLRMAGLRAEFVGGLSSYDAMIEALQNGAVDIMTNVNSTRRLADNIVRTVPVVRTPNALVAKISASEIKQISELFGRKVAVVKGYAQDQHLDRFPRIEKVHVRNNEEGFEAVRLGRAEYFLNNLANSGYVLKKTFATDLRIAGTLSYTDFPPLALSFGIHGKNSELPGIINKVLAAMPIHILSELQNKWLAEELTETDRIHLSPEEEAFIKAHPVLRVAFDMDWPPVEFTDKDLGMNGIAADYLKRMGELLGVTFEPSRPRSWKEMLRAVKNGELDFFSAISPTPQRREWLDFTDSYLSVPVVIITGKEVPYIGSMSDLKSKSVAVVDGYASHELLLENHPDLNLLPVRNVKEGLLTVSTGKAFAFIGSLATMSHVVSREGLTDLKVSGETPYAFDITMGTSKDNTVLMKILDKALASISTQERNEINSRWTSVTYEHAMDYSLIWRIIAGALIILALVLYWNGRLKREIAERKRAENAAESANRAKSSFLANMSHELRTPLNAILGFSELMSRDHHLSSEQLANLETIGRSGEHLLSLINDVLELSKIDAGRIVLHQENFDLHQLLLSLEEMFRMRSRQKGLSLNVEQRFEVPQFIRADQHKLRQVLINLLDNSVKFTETGEILLRVTCGEPGQEKQENSTCSLKFEVIDTGMGIAPEEQENVFDAFFQVGGQHASHQGTGLGLPISRKFVSMMGGALELQSEISKQTIFTFTIPVEQVEGADTEPSHYTRRVIGLDPGQAIFRLLVVEDNETNRALLVKLLQTVGFAVQEAVNGQEAVVIWEKWQPQLIWMDMRMPVMDGYQAIKEIKTSSKGKDPVIIALTASAFEEDRMKVLQHGGDDFVRKPFREVEIFEMLSKHLGVEFVYEAQNGETNGATMMSENAMQEAFSQLPEELCSNFLTAVDKIDFDRATVILNRIRELDQALADALMDLLNSYRFDTLQRLFEEVKE